MSQATPDQTKAVAGQILKTWWFWLLVAGFVWAGLLATEKLTAYQSSRFQGEIAQGASNQLAQSLVVISNTLREQMRQDISNQLTKGYADISNQIAAALASPEMQEAIKAAAAQQASQWMNHAAAPAFSNFQARLSQIQTQAQAKLDSLAAARPAPRIDATPPPAATIPSTPKPTVPKPTPSATDVTSGIEVDSEAVTKQGLTYILSVAFKKAGAGPLGMLHFALGAYTSMPARILMIDVHSDTISAVDKNLDPTGLEGTVSFTPLDGTKPALRVTLSGPTLIQITCDALSGSVTIPVLASLPGIGNTSTNR